jgi:SAM-dependent methyltransferase
MVVDKAGEPYWTQAWEKAALYPALDPRRPGPRNYAMRRFHEYFRQAFAGMDTAGKNFLEIGCARSVWLPYFAKEFGFKIHGLDYSAIGCQQAREILTREGLAGEIVFADFFSPPAAMLEKFDVVWSYGVAEHFTDTAACIAAFAKFLKPAGMAITLVPNMKGLIGLLQKLLNKANYDIHVPLGPAALRSAHEQAGLQVRRCDHFLSTSFGNVNMNSHAPETRWWRCKRVCVRHLSRFSKLIWAIETYTAPLPATALASPYIICTATKLPWS